MDNITHSLIGYAVGAAGVRVYRRKLAREGRPPLDNAWRRAVVVASVIGNNLPDLDVLLSPLVRASNYPTISQLLHHRGHTHTLAFAPIMALIGAALTAFLFRRAGPHRPPFWLLWAVCVVGAATHVLADSWNEYGVHPFWPVDSRWYYGDFVFILEPLLWAILGSFAAWDVRGRVTRGLLILPQVLIALAAWRMIRVPVPIALGITLAVVGLNLLQWRVRSVRVALGLTAALLGTLAISSATVKREIRSAFAAGASGAERIQQLITSPSPGNPLCWRTLVVAIDEPQDRYRVVAGGVSLWPSVFPADDCVFRLPGGESATAPTRPTAIPPTERVQWYGEYAASWSGWKKLAAENCSASAFLRFARAPFWVEIAGVGTVFGDMRYDREPGLGFSEYVDQPGKCPNFVPPWGQPIFQ